MGGYLTMMETETGVHLSKKETEMGGYLTMKETEMGGYLTMKQTFYYCLKVRFHNSPSGLHMYMSD